MNLTPCPEGKHIWTNVMLNGGNAFRSQGTALDSLERVNKNNSGILNGHNVRGGSPSSFEVQKHNLKYSYRLLALCVFPQFLKGFSLDSRFLYHFRQNEYYLFIIFGSESYRSAANLRPAKSHVAEKENFSQQSPGFF